MALAFDRTRMTPSLPYRLDKIMDLGLFVRMATRDKCVARQPWINVLHASAPHALHVSMATGRQCHQSSEHLAS